MTSDNALEVGKGLALCAGFAHDIGKASLTFHDKLRADGHVGPDDVRHEWLSMKLLQQLRVNGWSWTAAWDALRRTDLSTVTLGHRVVGSASPYGIADAFEAIDLLVATHHGLLQCQPGAGGGPACPTGTGRHVRRTIPDARQLVPAGDIASTVWTAYRNAEQELALTAETKRGDYVYWKAIALVTRAALIAADHAVSRMLLPAPRETDGLFANTTVVNGARRLNQPLDWHLLRVGERAAALWQEWSGWFCGAMPAPTFPRLSAAGRRRAEARTTGGRFGWQDIAADALATVRAESPGLPCLVFNMAGTGTGKTRMNIRAVCMLAGDGEVRVSIALNLRTLTLQTGRALERLVGLAHEDVAVVVGGGRLSVDEPPVDDDENPAEEPVAVIGEQQDLPGWAIECLVREADRRLMSAPVLVSTVDFLVAAGEPAAQHHHVTALLRVASADVVLDEIDAYEPESLVAVLRIVQLAAYAGRNVVCSSATLSVPVARAIEAAFRSGLAMRAAVASVRSLPCVWVAIDEHCPPEVHAADSTGDDAGFERWYAQRIGTLCAAIAAQPAKRVAELQPVLTLDVPAWREAVTSACIDLSTANDWVFNADQRISFGLVRVANVGCAVATAKHLAAALPHARVACYHANDFWIARMHKERSLDRLLARADGDDHIRADVGIQTAMAASGARSVPFIVVATPVEEIGRDHDFDWVVVDLSSAQSGIQVIGRSRRHRPWRSDVPNIRILQFNWRHCHNGGDPLKPAFCWPGFEDVRRRPRRGSTSGAYGNHDVTALLPWSDGTPRRLAVSSALRFDPRCTIARADDAAITRRLSQFIGEDGVFTSAKAHAWLLTQGQGSPYACTPLRSQTGMDEVWKIGGTDARPTFERQTVTAGRRGVQHVWLPDRLHTVDACDNAWLALGTDDMRAACAAIPIPDAVGMAGTFTRYSSNEHFVYDRGFGVYRST